MYEDRKQARQQDRGELLKDSVDMLLQKDQLERSREEMERSHAGSKPGVSVADDPRGPSPRTE